MTEQQAPHFIERLVAVAIAAVAVVAAACAAVEFSLLNEKTAVGLATYSGFGLLVIAWRWPRSITGPIRKVIGKQ